MPIVKKEVNNIKKGDYLVFGGEPYQVLEREHSVKQQRQAVVRLKLRNVKTGKVRDESVVSSGEVEEADIEKKTALFIYERNGEYWFHESGRPANRFFLVGEVIGEAAKFLKPGMEVGTVNFKDEIVGVRLPIKAEYEVMETQPAIKGATAAGGGKPARIETGAVVTVPMFVETGDRVVVNTETEEYVSRV